jgi:DNA-binding HxlR family transcriptional regulator
LLTRHVLPVSPIAVEYAITPLGRTLLHPMKVMHDWTMEQLPAVEEARNAYDQRGAGKADVR